MRTFGVAIKHSKNKTLLLRIAHLKRESRSAERHVVRKTGCRFSRARVMSEKFNGLSGQDIYNV